MPSAPLVKVTAVEYTLSSNTLPHPVQHLKYTHTKIIAPQIQNPKRSHLSTYRFSMALRLESGKKKGLNSPQGTRRLTWIHWYRPARQSGPSHNTRTTALYLLLYSPLSNNSTLLRSHQEPQFLTKILRVFLQKRLKLRQKQDQQKLKGGARPGKEKVAECSVSTFC